jgi:hypothetical protein
MKGAHEAVEPAEPLPRGREGTDHRRLIRDIARVAGDAIRCPGQLGQLLHGGLQPIGAARQQERSPAGGDYPAGDAEADAAVAAGDDHHLVSEVAERRRPVDRERLGGGRIGHRTASIVDSAQIPPASAAISITISPNAAIFGLSAVPWT